MSPPNENISPPRNLGSGASHTHGIRPHTTATLRRHFFFFWPHAPLIFYPALPHSFFFSFFLPPSRYIHHTPSHLSFFFTASHLRGAKTSRALACTGAATAARGRTALRAATLAPTRNLQLTAEIAAIFTTTNLRDREGGACGYDGAGLPFRRASGRASNPPNVFAPGPRSPDGEEGSLLVESSD